MKQPSETTGTKPPLKSKAKAVKPPSKAKVAEPPAETKAAELPPEDNAAAIPGEAKAAAPAAEAKPAKPRSEVRNKVIFALAIAGVVAALIAAYVFGLEREAQPPVFKPVSSPYETAIYANGMIESDQSNGSNSNIYPEVSGPITKVFVHEGQQVAAGTPLLTIDDSVQRANTEQLRLQSEAALALLNELKAQPREERSPLPPRR